MQRGDFRVVLDACVLAHIRLCDLFLRLAETPRMYTPVFSPEILTEVVRTQTTDLKWPGGLPEKWRGEVEKHFPEAIVTGYDHYLPVCTNDPKDRHVLAAAIHGQADTIVTFNIKDFPDAALSQFRISACRPGEYLITLYSIDGGMVVRRLNEMATRRNKPLEETLVGLQKSVPDFVNHVAEELGIELTHPSRQSRWSEWPVLPARHTAQPCRDAPQARAQCGAATTRAH